jgi:class 3 adenylate cyclase/DNA-binding CsgD family transcriptional regulator/tetratricopeptide (TPR) repeat protein
VCLWPPRSAVFFRGAGGAAILAAVSSPPALLPVGTVTLLFCDVEGSTALARRLGDDWLGVLAVHRDLLRGAVASHGGIELGTDGDGTRAVFVRARGAVAAAAEAQRALAEHGWPPGGRLRVRMGLHTGEPELTAEGYEGLDMHRAARVMAAGHGGQVLLSGSVRETLGERLPAGVAVRELGLYVLADLPRPEHLFQLDIEGLPVEFPALSARPARRGARGVDPAVRTGDVRAGQPRRAARVAERRVGDAAAARQRADGAGRSVLALARPRAAVDAQPVGREEPLAQLERFIAALADGPGGLLIEGEAGIGKTTVWQFGVDAAVGRGYRVLISRPAEAESALAYSGLADLLEAVDSECFDELPEPQRAALEVALLRAEPTGSAHEPRAIFSALGGVLRRLAREAPVLVAIDDRQWLDASSLRALEFVARRLVDEPVGVLAAARPSGAPAWSVGDAVLRLAPLSAAALHQLIKARADVGLSRPVVLRVHRTTGGNPFFALELTKVLVTAGMPDAAQAWPVPDDLRDMVTARLAVLPADTRSALLTAAASARPAVAGLDADVLAPAQHAGIVTIAEDGRVRFAHPLLAAAIYDSARPAERRRVHAVLADEAGDVEEQARHLALACESADETVAQLLDRATATARARGAPDIAAELAERAHALTPADQPDRAFKRRLTACEHLFHAGDLERTRRLLAELVRQPAPPTERSRALRILGQTCYRLGLLDDAMRWLGEAVDSAPGDPGSIARAELSRSFALFKSFGSYADASAAAERALAEAEALEDRALLAGALAASVGSDLLNGRGLDEERLARALELEDPQQPSAYDWTPSWLAGEAWTHTEQFDRARAVLQGLCERLVERGEDSDLPEPLGCLAWAECFAGNLAAAAELADRGHELARQARSESLAAYTRAMRALVYAHEGREDETRHTAAEAIELATRSGWLVAAFFASVALAHLELSLGNDAAVIQTLAHSIELVERDGVIDPGRRPFLPDAIEALIRLGDLERGERLTALLEESARALHRKAATVSAARCRALITAAQGDTEGALRDLDHVLGDTPDVPVPLELARTMIVKGQLERRRKHKRHARASLDRAVEISEHIGATLWAQRARRESARLGRVHDPDELTATEARVATLAASGLTNREVAAAAFLSQKTVEANIARVYRKLAIHSRAELGAWLAERDGEAH